MYYSSLSILARLFAVAAFELLIQLHPVAAITLDECIGVCLAETRDVSWQPSQHNPGAPPNGGDWGGDRCKRELLRELARVVHCRYDFGDPGGVATPIPPDEFPPAGHPNRYQYSRCHEACAGVARQKARNEQAFCERCNDSHHFYMRKSSRGENGDPIFGDNPPGYTGNPPAPDWDQDPATRRRPEGRACKYAYDTTTGRWIEIIFPEISEVAWDDSRCLWEHH